MLPEDEDVTRGDDYQLASIFKRRNLDTHRITNISAVDHEHTGLFDSSYGGLDILTNNSSGRITGHSSRKIAIKKQL